MRLVSGSVANNAINSGNSSLNVCDRSPAGRHSSLPKYVAQRALQKLLKLCDRECIRAIEAEQGPHAELCRHERVVGIIEPIGPGDLRLMM
jgi:hypothetical protein